MMVVFASGEDRMRSRPGGGCGEGEICFEYAKFEKPMRHEGGFD
jgi:hypothetical protein